MKQSIVNNPSSCKEHLESALFLCSDIDVLIELENAIDDPIDFAKILGVEAIELLQESQQCLTSKDLINLLSNHKLEVLHPLDFRSEYEQLSVSERFNLYILRFVKVENLFASVGNESDD